MKIVSIILTIIAIYIFYLVGINYGGIENGNSCMQIFIGFVITFLSGVGLLGVYALFRIINSIFE